LEEKSADKRSACVLFRVFEISRFALRRCRRCVVLAWNSPLVQSLVPVGYRPHWLADSTSPLAYPRPCGVSATDIIGSF
jgi:hypothetical protein